MFYTLKTFWGNVQFLLQKEVQELGLGAVSKTSKSKSKTKIMVRLIMQIVVSIAILSFAIKVLLNSSTEYAEKTREIASGMLGTIVGYWIR